MAACRLTRPSVSGEANAHRQGKMVATARKPLGQLLLDKGLLKPDQLQRALEDAVHAMEVWP